MNICESTQNAVRPSSRFSDFDGLMIEWSGQMGRYWKSYGSEKEYKEAIQREEERQFKERKRKIKKRKEALLRRKRERDLLRSDPDPIRLGELV